MSNAYTKKSLTVALLENLCAAWQESSTFVEIRNDVDKIAILMRAAREIPNLSDEIGDSLKDLYQAVFLRPIGEVALVPASPVRDH